MYQHENGCVFLFYDDVGGFWVAASSVAVNNPEWLARSYTQEPLPDLSDAHWTVRGFDGEELVCPTMCLCAYKDNGQIRTRSDRRERWTRFDPCGRRAAWMRPEMLQFLIPFFTEREAEARERDKAVERVNHEVQAMGDVLAAAVRFFQRNNEAMAKRLQTFVLTPPQRQQLQQQHHLQSQHQYPHQQQYGRDGGWLVDSVETLSRQVEQHLKVMEQSILMRFVHEAFKRDTSTDAKLVNKVCTFLSHLFQHGMMQGLKATVWNDRYLPVRAKYPGLVHFLFVDRSKDQLFCSPIDQVPQGEAVQLTGLSVCVCV